MFAGKKSAQIREILISESAWEEMTCLFAPSLALFWLTNSVCILFDVCNVAAFVYYQYEVWATYVHYLKLGEIYAALSHR